MVFLFQVLNDLYHLLRFETCKSIHRAFEVVLSAMDRHLRVKHMQISGRFVLNPNIIGYFCVKNSVYGSVYRH